MKLISLLDILIFVISCTKSIKHDLPIRKEITKYIYISIFCRYRRRTIFIISHFPLLSDRFPSLNPNYRLPLIRTRVVLYQRCTVPELYRIKVVPYQICMTADRARITGQPVFSFLTHVHCMLLLSSLT